MLIFGAFFLIESQQRSLFFLDYFLTILECVGSIISPEAY